MGSELDKKVLPVRPPDSLEAPMNVDISREINGFLFNSETKLMQCMNICEEGQAIQESCGFDITDCGSLPNSGLLEDCPEDVAEYSSSFGGTDPGTIIYSGVSNGEVESTYAGLGMSGSFNKGYGDVFALSLSMGMRDTRTGVFPNYTSPPLDASLPSPMGSLLATSKRVASSSQGDDLPYLKEPITLPYGIKRTSQEIEDTGADTFTQIECDNNPRKSQAAKKEPVDVDQLGNLPSSKSREQSEIPRNDCPGLGVGSELPAEGPSHLERLNKRLVSTTKTYVRKRRRRG